MWRRGTVQAIRKTEDGRYVIIYSQPDRTGEIQKLHIARYVHLAVGYPGIRILPDLQDYRDRTRDMKSVVNAYEPHDYIYKHLAQKGGTVVVRGRGIVASRVIQRLYEARQDNPKRPIKIFHLHRSPTSNGNQYGSARRRVENHWEFQPFNWPKANWGGDLRVRLEQANSRERQALLTDWGGTTTANRPDWRNIVRTGLAEGWYVNAFGEVEGWQKNEQNKLETWIKGNQLDAKTRLIADFIIDATGLEASIDKHPLLKDLTQTYRLSRNTADRLDVTNSFAVKGMDNGPGRLYASGTITFGGPYAPVDSFLGLQYAAMRSVDELTTLKAPGLRYLNGLRSLIQWIRWAGGVQP
jgi:hypothetical protein